MSENKYIKPTDFTKAVRDEEVRRLRKKAEEKKTKPDLKMKNTEVKFGPTFHPNCMNAILVPEVNIFFGPSCSSCGIASILIPPSCGCKCHAGAGGCL